MNDGYSTDWVAARYGHWWEPRDFNPDETLEERTAVQYWRTVSEVADTEPPASFYADNTGGNDRLEQRCDNTQAAMLNDYLWDGDTS